MTRTFSFPARGRGAKKPLGFSLVEIMVALVIGLIGVLVIMQVARTAEAQKRTTTGSGDTQSNAALAMYSVERDLKQAGYGVSSLNVLGCPVSIPARGDSLPARTLGALAPVRVNPPTDDSGLPFPAADAGTDSLLIVYGDSAGAPEGDRIPSLPEESGGKQYIGVKSAANFRLNEWILAARPDPSSACASAMRKILAILDPDSSELGFQYTIAVDEGAGAVDGGLLFGLGPKPSIIGYAIRGGDLTMCDYMAKDCASVGNWLPISNGIVSLQAQYGQDTSGDGAIDAWVEPDDFDPATAPGGWASISAVRLALIARNSEPDKEELEIPLTWADGTSIDLITHTDILMPAGFSWKNYRYQVYETVIPLRNIPWMEL